VRVCPVVATDPHSQNMYILEKVGCKRKEMDRKFRCCSVGFQGFRLNIGGTILFIDNSMDGIAVQQTNA